MQPQLRTLLRAGAGALAVTAFVFLGLFAYVDIANRHAKPAEGETLVFREGRIHPVTPAMAQAASELGGASAPNFEATLLDGTPCSLASLTRGKPLVLYFIEVLCPCCKGAKPYIDRIQTRYGDVCNVVGVIDAKPSLAQVWANTVKPQFDVLPDPQMAVIRGFRAQRGVYTTLIAPNGRIVTAYPGYSQDMLHDLTKKIARLAGVKERSMSVEPAPIKLTSGCIFPGTKLPGDEL